MSILFAAAGVRIAEPGEVECHERIAVAKERDLLPPDRVMAARAMREHPAGPSPWIS